VFHVYPEAKHQRCWPHKTVNILSKLPKSRHSDAKADLREIWQAATKKEADDAFDRFIDVWEPKYPKAASCLEKDRDSLLTFYSFPAHHWCSLRTTNPIESTFATVRHRTKRSKGCLSRRTMLAMVFKLSQSAQRRWRRLRGYKHIADVVRGVSFNDGIKLEDAA
jgi:transposase-like protein